MCNLTLIDGIHGRPRRGGWASLWLCVSFALATAFPAVVRADKEARQEQPRATLESELRRGASEMLDAVHEYGWRKIGVLKFRAKLDQNKASENVGPFNLMVARRLEAALGLAPILPHRPIQLVRDSSSVAAQIQGASHLSEAGRARLFAAKYPVTWGTLGDTIHVDGFLTGVAFVDTRLGTLELSVLAVHPGESALEHIWTSNRIDLEPRLLPELGLGFTSRSPNDSPVAAIEAARQQTQPGLLAAGDTGKEHVHLRVLYDGKEMTPRRLEGEWVIPEPREGQIIEFELQRMDNLPHAVGVVLKVNGENTAELGEMLDSRYCRKWVLPADNRKYKVKGYRISDKQYREFRGAPSQETPRLEMQYGTSLGMITMELFRELKGQSQEEPTPLGLHQSGSDDENNDPDLAAIATARVHHRTPRDQREYQQQVRANAENVPMTSRGAIAPGHINNHTSEEVVRSWERSPLTGVVIRYLRP